MRRYRMRRADPEMLSVSPGSSARRQHPSPTAVQGRTVLLSGDGHRRAFERAQIQLRAGVALAAVGEREAAVERLTEAYRTAKRLEARPVAEEAVRQLVALGEHGERRLGRRAAGQLERAGLTRRELEVVRLVAVGRTNREIGQELFLSARTVEMPVGNVLTKLDCRTRTEVTHKAELLGCSVVTRSALAAHLERTSETTLPA